MRVCGGSIFTCVSSLTVYTGNIFPNIDYSTELHYKLKMDHITIFFYSYCYWVISSNILSRQNRFKLYLYLTLEKNCSLYKSVRSVYVTDIHKFSVLPSFIKNRAYSTSLKYSEVSLKSIQNYSAVFLNHLSHAHITEAVYIAQV